MSRSDPILGAALRRLWHHGAWALLGGVLGLAVGYLALTQGARLYEARALIEITTPETGRPDALSPAEAADRARVVLQSREVLRGAAEASGYAFVAAPAWLPLADRLPPALLPDRVSRDDAAALISRLDLPADLREAGLELRIAEPPGAGAFRLTLPDGRALSGRAGAPLSDPASGVAIEVSLLEGPVGRAFRLVRLPPHEAEAELRERLSVSARGERTALLDMSLLARSPAQAEAVLGAVIAAFVAQDTAMRRDALAAMVARAGARAEAARAALDTARAGLNAFRLTRGTVDIEAEAALLLSRLDTLRETAADLDLRQQRLADRYDAETPVLRDLATERAEIARQTEAARAELRRLPDVMQTLAGLQEQVALGEERHAAARRSVAALERMRDDLPPAAIVVDPPAAWPEPVSPATGTTLVTALALGMMSGALLSVLRPGGGGGRATAEAELRDLGVPVLCGLALAHDTGLEAPLAEADRAALDVVLTAIRASGQGGRAPVALVTGPAGSGGLAELVPAVARMAAARGLKTCVIAAAPGMAALEARLAAPAGEPGLTEVLSGQLSLRAALRDTPVPDVVLLPAGRPSADLAGLMAGAALGELVQAARAEADIVLVAAPPVPREPSAGWIARHATIRLVVVGPERGARELVRTTEAILRLSGAGPDALVMQDAPRRRPAT